MMLLGKRPRPPIRRTTSMTGITVDLSNVEESEGADCATNDRVINNGFDQNYYSSNNVLMMSGGGGVVSVSPRNRRNSLDYTVETAPFLRTCGLCKRRLSPGRDLYMYRGDTAFCSQECRELQMKQDERSEKMLRQSGSSNDDHRHTST